LQLEFLVMLFEFYILLIAIIILTIAALFDLWRVSWFYRKEQKILNRLIKELKESNELSELNKLKAMNQIRTQRSSTPLYERIQLMNKLKKTGKLKYFQDFMQLATNKKLKPIIINEIVSNTQRRALLAQFSIVILFIIGITGMILSMLIDDEMAAKIINSISETKPLLADEVHNVFEKLHLFKLNALYIFAIVCAVCLSFIKLVFVQPIKEYFITHLDWVTLFYLIPIYDQNEQQQASLKELEQSLNNSITKLHKQLIRYRTELSKQHSIPIEFDKIIKEFPIAFQQAKEAADQLKKQLEESAR